jgi:hypothetical protein
MQANVVLLMLIPAMDDSGPTYNVISSPGEGVTIPSITLQDKFGSIDNVLNSIIEYHLGALNFEPSRILYDVQYNSSDDSINIYYYTFLPRGISLQNGYTIDIKEIQNLQSYQKLIYKIQR